MGNEDRWDETQAVRPAPPPSRVYRETPWGRLQMVPEDSTPWRWVLGPTARLRTWLASRAGAVSDHAVGLAERCHAWRAGNMSRRARTEWRDYYERRAESGHDLARFQCLLVRNGPPDVTNPYAHADPASIIPAEGCIAMDIVDVLAAQDTARSALAANAWMQVLALARPIPDTLAVVHRDNLLLATFEAIQLQGPLPLARIERLFRAAVRMGVLPPSDVQASVRMATLLATVDTPATPPAASSVP